MSPTTISFAINDGIATLTLNRPEVLNSFNTQMHAELRAALSVVERDPAVRCLLLTGAGRAFCAGQDLSEGDVINADDAGATLEQNYIPLITRLRALPLPIVCAVNGTAAGAGASLALAADIVLAARSAKFIQAFSKIGLVPDAGSTWLLPRLIGHARALALAITGEAITAEQAVQWGLIWRCHDEAELAGAAQTLAAQLARMPTHAIALIKQAYAATSTNTLLEQLYLERWLQRDAGRSADAKEGITAFIEKRPPKFIGK